MFKHCLGFNYMDVRGITLTPIDLFSYQDLGDAKTPCLAQYSAVVSEDSPVNASHTTIKNNMPIKK